MSSARCLRSASLANPRYARSPTIARTLGRSARRSRRSSRAAVVLHQVPDPLSQGLLAVDQDAGHPLELIGDAAHGQRTVALAIAGEIARAQVVAEGPGHDHERIDALGTGEVVDDVALLAEAGRRMPVSYTHLTLPTIYSV